jgi:hypothetical protein
LDLKRGRQMGFPVIFEHVDACGVLRGEKVRVPAIAAAAVILVCRGADRILVPTPSSYEEERTEEGIERLPKERRSLVRIVDKRGEVLQRVRSYLEPLVAQAKKWPEDAFVGFAESFLYQVALGTDFTAGIVSHAVETVRGFIPMLDPQFCRGKARFRLAEIVSLICSYEPDLTDHGAYRLDLVPKTETAPQIWKLIESAEFGAIVAAPGRIGYLKRPMVALRRLRKATRDFIGRPETAKLLRLATTTADFAGAKTVVESSKGIVELLGTSDSRPFCPPFMDLGPAQMGLYRVALADAFPGAVPPERTIFVFEHPLGGRVSHSWLNVGEELKLEHEAQDIRGRQEASSKARSAQTRFI